MRISIALCTYNGARYIEEQLRSLAAQTRLPDELVVCDDCSTDGTLAVVSSFAAHAPFPILYSRNESQLGVTKNFERAIGRCSGDVIFLCDQDDIWMPQKIETILQPFVSHPGVGLVFSDAIVTDSQLNHFDYTMWRSVEFTPRRQRQVNGDEAMHVLVRRYVVTGATMAFRAGLREHVLPIPPKCFHDAWIAAVGGMLSRIVAIQTPLILYRQHGNNVIGGIRMGRIARLKQAWRLTPEWFDLEVERARSLLEKIRLTGDTTRNKKHLAALEQRLIHLESRRAMFDLALPARAALIARELWAIRYARYSGGFKAAILDLVTKGKFKAA